MDFFDSQDRARRSTGRMVTMFVVGVIVLTIATTAVITAAVSAADAFHPIVPIAAAGGTLLVIFLGSAYKLAELRGGGRVVAEALGGRRVDPGSRDPAQRRLLNVVEEMAIASGVPVPPVYIMEETGVNAFAAGFAPDAAVIGVTRGCVELLTRDELQGVIAHEFSHILNGDMRLNLRLIGVLHGILVIGLIGGTVLRVTAYSGAGRRSSNRDGNAAGMILALGAALAVLGYAGTLIGNLIKAAISRQREYLADASAVQFTRNPDGIGGALRKIGAIGSKLRSPRAAEASHMYFAKGLSAFGLGLSTHPPLEDRIRRVDPSWDGAWPDVGALRAQLQSSGGVAAFAGDGPPAPAPAPASAPATAPVLTAGAALVGAPRPEHVTWARQLLERLPAPLLEAARDPHDARVLVYALLIDTDAHVRERQCSSVARADVHAGRRLERILPHVDAAPAEGRLPLLELALPALSELGRAQYDAFTAQAQALIEADERVSVFEWLLMKAMEHTLASTFDGEARRRARIDSLQRLGAECADLLSLLAFAGARDRAGAEAAFAAGARVLGIHDELRSPSDISLARFDSVVRILTTVAPRWQRRLVQACAETIACDRVVTVDEAELFRGVSIALGTPVPPVTAGMPLAA